MKYIMAIVLTIGLTINFLSSNCYCETIDNIISSNSPFESKSENASPSAALGNGSKSDMYAVQTGVYFNQEQADKQIVNLKSKGLDPYIFQSRNSKDQILYAVRVGIFETPQAAAAKLDEISSQLASPAVITTYGSMDTVSLHASSPEKSEEVPAVSQKKNQSSSAENTRLTDHSTYKSAYASEQAGPSAGDLESRLEVLEAEIEKLREEAEVRRKLQVTEEEARAEQEDILEAAGRQYTLTDAGNIKFSYGFGYTYSEYDAIREASRIEDVANHTISNSFTVSYGVKDNLTVSTGIPFVYKYNRVGTVHEKDITDLGDLSLDWRYQPFKTTSDLPTIIVNGGFNVPVGRSPYEIDPGEELSTSSGIYSTSIGASVSQTSDPVVVFSSFSVNYPFTVTDIGQKRNEGILDEVDPGINFGISAGMAYALSYKLNLNMSVSYSYSLETEYKYLNAPTAETGTSASASIRIGTGYRLSPKQNLNFSFGIPITDTGKFSFSFSTPIEFEL